MTALSFDVASYLLLSHLSPYPALSKVQSDNITPSPWFSAMGLLIGTMYKRYPHMEIRGLMNLFVNSLRNRAVFDLYTFRVRVCLHDWVFSRFCP
jgi:hypothetical protein